MLTGIYDLAFSKEELKKISKLRKLDEQSRPIAWITGLIIFLSVFLLQTLFHGVDLIHALSTYGCIPIGVLSGWYVNKKIDTYVEQQFINKWDKLYYERKDSSPAKEAANAEIRQVTDDLNFYSLPKAEQSRILKEIYRKHGV
ncbi:MAG: hypothetical protein ACKVI8_22775 [Paraglaciecola sp.]|jgi:hypothetical protein